MRVSKQTLVEPMKFKEKVQSAGEVPKQRDRGRRARGTTGGAEVAAHGSCGV